MAKRLQRWRRIVITGGGWLFFGAMMLALGVLVAPWLRLRRGDPQLRSQAWLNAGFRVFERLLVRGGLIRVSWSGLEGLESAPPRIYVANHPSLIDALLILAKLPYGDVVVAESYAKHWAMRAAIAAAGYVSTGLGPAVVDACVERLRGGRVLVLFPEGTRSPMHGLGPFHRGAARVALQTGCEIVPISIRLAPPMLRRGQKWYDIPPTPGHFEFRVGEPLSPKDFDDDSLSPGVNARMLTSEIRRVLSEASDPGEFHERDGETLVGR